MVQSFPNHLFRRGIAGKFRIGGVRKEKQNPLCPQLGQPGQVSRPAADRRVVNLKIAAMNDNAQRRLYNQAHGVRNTVTNREELDFKFSQGKRLAGGHQIEAGPIKGFAFLELDLDQPLGQLGGIDRRLKLGQQIGQRADMVFVAMGDNDAPYFSLPLQEIADIGNHQIDAQHFFFGEHESGVDDNNVILIFHDHHVFTDFTQPAEGNYF